jgi:hypothetical protein
MVPFGYNATTGINAATTNVLGAGYVTTGLTGGGDEKKLQTGQEKDCHVTPPSVEWKKLPESVKTKI